METGGGTAGWRRAWLACVRRGFEPRILLRGYSVNGVLADGVPVWGGASVDCRVDRSHVEGFWLLRSEGTGFSGEWRFPSASPMRHSSSPELLPAAARPQTCFLRLTLSVTPAFGKERKVCCLYSETGTARVFPTGIAGVSTASSQGEL